MPESIKRPNRKSELRRRVEFLESVIDDGENGQSLHQSFIRHRYPQMHKSQLEKFFYLAFNSGITILPPLKEFLRESKFLIEREREIAIEIAPARATLTLLTFFPALILFGAMAAKIIHLDGSFFAPIPMGMIATSLLFQVIGRRWSESIIKNVAN